MTHKIKIFAFAICLACLAASCAKEQKYLFFLHNRFIEEHGDEELHPSYGKAFYSEIIDTYDQAGFVVFSERRPAGTDVIQYAHKVESQIDSLLKLGVLPENISVVGTSKGGFIAQYVSTFVKNPNINFVFIGSIFEGDVERTPEIEFCGNILAIRERTDTLSASAYQRIKSTRLKVTEYKDIELNTGLHHGFLFQPLQDWLGPSIEWAKGNYRLEN